MKSNGGIDETMSINMKIIEKEKISFNDKERTFS